MRNIALSSIYSAAIVATALSFGALGEFTSVAAATPGEDMLSPDPTVTALKSMGMDNSLALYGLQGTQALTMPVPPGLTPSTLDALVELPVGVRAGTITVTQDERTLARVPLPTDFGAPLSIPLAGAAVVDNAVTFTLHSYLDPFEGYCLYDPTHPPPSRAPRPYQRPSPTSCRRS
jgi:hypothetical protein